MSGAISPGQALRQTFPKMTSTLPDPIRALPTDIAPSSSEEDAHLLRLQGYLRDDPDNEFLLAEAFDAALACGQWSIAAQYVRQAFALRPDDAKWTLRKAHLHMATADFDLARRELESLAYRSDARSELSDILLHDLSFIDLHRNEVAACVSRLTPRMALTRDMVERASAWPASLVSLWLRALHRQGELQNALDWLQAWPIDETEWPPEIAGVASLVALDAQRLDCAQRWSDQALRQPERSGGPRSAEAWLTQASLALLMHDTARARHCAGHAAALRPEEGRVISTSAFIDLQTGQFEMARAGFLRALRLMPRHIGTWHGLGWTQVLQLDLPSAQSSFESALSLAPNFADSHGALAVVAVLRKDPSTAQNRLRRATRLNPANLPGQIAKSILDGTITDASALQQHLQHLVSVHPEEGASWAVDQG